MLSSTILEKKAFDNFHPFLQNLVPCINPVTSSFQKMQKTLEGPKLRPLERKANSKGKLQVMQFLRNIMFPYRPDGAVVCTPVFR